ncbi:NAD(P)-binding protein [Trichoderma sp. SZMC 28015]
MSNPSDFQLPETFRGLQFTSPSKPGSVVELPTPLPSAGSVFSNGNVRGYKYPLPLIPGTNGICRIAAPATDTPHLQVGMLVYTSGIIRPRDNLNMLPLLQGIHMGASPEGQALMNGEWRNAENIHVLNEHILTKELGYTFEDLGYISTLAVPFGGLSDIGLRPGETVIVAPATGNFGSAAVLVALAMGAGKVIAVGRNEAKLKQICNDTNNGKVVPVTLLEDLGADTAALQAHGPVDVYFDISPNSAAKALYIKAGISALRRGGRVSFMGGIMNDIDLPYHMMMFKALTLKGTFMYTPQQVNELIRLIETGLLPIGEKGKIQVSGRFPLHKWEEAFENASGAEPMKATYFQPNFKS